MDNSWASYHNFLQMIDQKMYSDLARKLVSLGHDWKNREGLIEIMKSHVTLKKQGTNPETVEGHYNVGKAGEARIFSFSILPRTRFRTK
jgi:hypothetical protein